jgi:hypothetical protein
MELDELKSAWKSYDQKLSENLKLNEQLLRNMNLERSKREINSPLISEIISIMIGFAFLLFFVSTTLKNSGEMKFLIPGLMNSIICFVILVLSAKKIRLLSEIDLFNTPIVELQRAILIVKQKMLLYKKIEFCLMPFFGLFLAPILIKGLRNIDIYGNPIRYIIALFIGLGIGYPLAIWIYKHWYQKKLNNVEILLNELKMFELEKSADK